MYKYILLDWDGCLAKTLDLWLNAYLDVFEEEGIKTNVSEVVQRAFGQREKGMENLGSKDPNVSWAKVVALVEKNMTTLELYENVPILLEGLKNNNKKIALLTSSDKKTISEPIKRLRVEKYFDVILTKDDVVNRKPDPEIFLKGLERIGGNKDEAIVIGDSYHDVRGGKNAGIKTVAFYPRENEKFYARKELEIEKPDYFITDLKDLLKIVE